MGEWENCLPLSPAPSLPLVVGEMTNEMHELRFLKRRRRKILRELRASIFARVPELRQRDFGAREILQDLWFQSRGRRGDAQ